MEERPQESIDYKIDYQAELNPQQYEAVTSINGPHLVIAGAGSGKTRTLVYRVAYLVENNVDPWTILLLTFTRKAAEEMMRRAADILDIRCARVSGGTYHSFANLMLRRHASYMQMPPNFNILDRADAEDVINMFRKDMGLSTKQRRFPRKRTLMDMFSKATNKCEEIETIIEDEYPYYMDDFSDILAVYRQYTLYKKERQVMDFDDLLIGLRDLLAANEDVRRKVSNTYAYIMVDEFQDTNKIQADITRLLASEHHNIMAVGDDSQSIYSFRGANFRNIMDFPNLFPGTRIITMEQNYRSTLPILDLTNAVIEQAKEKYSKTLFSEIKGKHRPVFVHADDVYEQSDFILDRIAGLRKQGVPLEQVAVLFRASWFANELEVELKNSGIPYVKYGGLKFSESAHVKDVMAYMRVLHNVYDEVAWLRLLQLMEGVGPASARKIVAGMFQNSGDVGQLVSSAFSKKKFGGELKALHELLAGLADSPKSPSEQMEAVMAYYARHFEIKYDDFRKRQEDLTSLYRVSERYPDLERMITDLALDPPETLHTETNDADKTKGKLVLSTIHSAKGLEWHTVFIIHLVEGHFPSEYSKDDEEQLEEERRLFYVGATRAKQRLYLITPELKTSSGYYSAEPSRFITEIPGVHHLIEGG